MASNCDPICFAFALLHLIFSPPHVLFLLSLLITFYIFLKTKIFHYQRISKAFQLISVSSSHNPHDSLSNPEPKTIMAGVFSAQHHKVEDMPMRDVSMFDADELRMGIADQYYDPMDISPLPTHNQQSQSIAQSMELTSDLKSPKPPYWVAITRGGGVPKATRVDGQPTRIRTGARFSPKARMDPFTGRFKPSIVTQPLRDRPNNFSLSNRYSSAHSSNVLKALPYNPYKAYNPLYKPVTGTASFSTTRDSSFNSLKSIFDRKTPSFESNTSIATAEYSNSRKRSVDEGSNEQSHDTASETDSPSAKYRRVNRIKDFPDSAVASQEDSQGALTGADSGQHAHPTLGSIVPTSSPAQGGSSTYPQQVTPPVAFNSRVSTSAGTVGDQIGQVSLADIDVDTTDTHIPGEWPEGSPSSATGAFAPIPAQCLLRPGEGPMMSGALLVTSATPALSDSGDIVVTGAGDQQASNALWAVCENAFQAVSAATAPGSLKKTIANVFNRVWMRLTTLPVAQYVQSRRRPRSPSRSSSPRASPSRVASLRALPEEQRRRIKDYEWRRQRGYPTVQNLPFPDLTVDIPQFPTSGSPSLMENIGDSGVERQVKSARGVQKHPRSSMKDTKHRHAKTGIKPVGIQKSPLVKSVSPNLKRRLMLRPRYPERAQRELLLQKAWRTGNFSELLQKQGVSTYVEPPKRKEKKRVRFKEPLTEYFSEPSLPDLAPYLHAESPIVDRITHEKPLADEQQENVPPTIALEARAEVEVPCDEGVEIDDRLFDEPDFFPFGSAVSAVRLFSEAKPLPPGRTESIYAEEWKKIEEKQKQEERPARIRPKGPVVRPLTEYWLNRVSQAMAGPSSKQVATTLSGDPLTKKDLTTCFTPEAWLNDEVINSYLALIVEYLRRTNNNSGRNDKPKFHAFNSFFFSNLRDKGYQSVRRWATRAKIGGATLLNVDTVFVPVHNSAHWTLIVIKPGDRTIENFDSMGSVSARHVSVIKDWLRNELGDLYVAKDWKVLPSVSPQQTNGSDCGVFLLSTAKAVAIGLEPLSYCGRDIILLREKIVAELMAGGLEGDFDPCSGGEVLL
ncbi:hypothetical protein BBP40_003519 [Aspergillus hancockii]|nr:hypothetical protein BBP40_003519 [Aspergillus hancockii]